MSEYAGEGGGGDDTTDSPNMGGEGACAEDQLVLQLKSEEIYIIHGVRMQICQKTLKPSEKPLF